MKTNVLLFLFLLPFKGFSQDSLQVATMRTQIFSLSPISKKVDKVNGLVFGVGHVDNKNVDAQTINGVNAEINPAPIVGAFMAFLTVMYLPEIIARKNKEKDSLNLKSEPDLKIKNWEKTPYLKVNGFNLSTGCFFTDTSMNGLNVSLGNKFKNFNGLSVAPLGTISDIENGVSLGVVNINNNLNGFTAGVYNQSFELNGLHIGVVNLVKRNHGLQIGVFNRSYSDGFQIGVWNRNSRRSLPILNW